jgi:hypothetical protein
MDFVPKKSNALPDTLQARVEYHLSKSREIRAVSQALRETLRRENPNQLVTEAPTPTPRPTRKR